MDEQSASVGGLARRLAAAGAGAPLALVHRLHPGNRDRPALLDQVAAQLLRRWQQIGPRVTIGNQPGRRVHREVGGRDPVRDPPRAPGTTPEHPA